MYTADNYWINVCTHIILVTIIIIWTKHQIWLEPAKETNTYRRDNFSIHGGWWPGSAGCIDLTENMADFTQWLKKHGQDLIVKVSYR